MRITYSTFRNAPKLSFNDWNKYLNEISTSKKLDVNTVKVTCISCNFRFFYLKKTLYRQNLLTVEIQGSLGKQ